MAERRPPFDSRREGGPAARQAGGYGGAPAYGRGYGRDFGGGLGQGFGGSWGQGYGGSTYPTGYAEELGGDQGWTDARFDAPFDAGRGPYAGRGPKGWRRSDERLREEVCERLSENRLLDARGIEVEVDDGAVTLRGAVPGASDPRLAEMLVRDTAGVREVVNELRHEPGQRRPLSI